MILSDNQIFALLQKEVDFVYFRSPSMEQPELFIDSSDNEQKEKFIFHPFSNSSRSCEIRNSTTAVLQPFSSFGNYARSLNDRVPKAIDNLIEINQESYLNLIDRTVSFLKENSLNKVVLSRIVKSDINDLHQLEKAFLLLREQHPKSLVYLWSHKDSGIWMGATPEQLISGKNNTYTTHSLAGTLPNHAAQKWTDKELNEQKYVTDYILKQLKKAGAADILVQPLESVLLPHIKHLRNIINFNFNGDILDVIKYLHPTPAVGGTPKKEAVDYILKNESHKRHFYTGYLGVVTENECALYVNLRCMHLNPPFGYLFVGGGITKDSNNLKEWKETENKSLTLLSVL